MGNNGPRVPPGDRPKPPEKEKPPAGDAAAEWNKGAAARPERLGEARRAGKVVGKTLGELPELPKDTSPVVKGVGFVEGAAKTLALAAEVAEKATLGAAFEGVGGLLMVGAMAAEFMTARADWEKAGGTALEMAGVQLSMKIMGGDASLGRSAHILEGQPYTAAELFKQINDRLPGAWDRWAFEQAGAGDKAWEHMNRGLTDAANEANRLLKRFGTPAERSEALGTFARTIDARIEQNMQRRADELRASRARR